MRATSQMAGQGCIGRLLDALKGEPTRDSGKSIAERGCDWAAFGLFARPWTIVMPDGHEAQLPSQLRRIASVEAVTS